MKTAIGIAIGILATAAMMVRPPTREDGARPAPPAVRKILYYRDPMHPAYTSDKPGIAPDCGMQLEAVYNDAPPDAVNITPRIQQMMGIGVEEARQVSGSLTLRLLGRVSADETRVYRVGASAAGWIQEVKPVTSGAIVHKGERLADFYTPEFLGAEQAFLFALRSLDRFQEGKESADQIALTQANVQQYADSLRSLGMSDAQIEDLRHTRQATQRIWINAPASGIVLARNTWEGQRFDRGTEFFRIADISHIWVVADVYESDAGSIAARARVRVTLPGRQDAFDGVVSDVLPQFDPNTRVSKVRIDVENAAYLLRPDMFVDVAYTVQLPPSLSVPVDAVLATGLHQTVFVRNGEGAFEPRVVRTGKKLGDRIQILKGLQAGEQVAISGTFFIDSETRMRFSGGTP
jgi:Cu(I)/Ag(I) efflux system membrane fusion protein